jgi:hypothetical protein
MDEVGADPDCNRENSEPDSLLNTLAEIPRNSRPSSVKGKRGGAARS